MGGGEVRCLASFMGAGWGGVAFSNAKECAGVTEMRGKVGRCEEDVQAVAG